MENIPTPVEKEETKEVQVDEKNPAPKGGASFRKNNFLNLKTDRKKVLIIAVALILVGLALNLKSLFIAAVVNGHPVSRLQVIHELEQQFGEQALNALITKKLIAEEAAQRKIVIAPTEIDQEIESIRSQIEKQGMKLEEALEEQGLTVDAFREQIMIQKELEKILADKIQVTDEEVAQYMTENKLTVPAGTNEADFKQEIKDQLKSQKVNMEANKWIAEIKAKAKIQYWVEYATPPTPPSPLPEEGQ